LNRRVEEVAIGLAAAALVVAIAALRAARRPREGMLEPRSAPDPRYAAPPPDDPYRDPDETASVVLLDLGPREIHVIKAIRNATGLGLKDAKDLAEAPPPVTLAGNLPPERARAFLAELEAAGASAELA
jgi:large subunit ribosomal protein L7/L12